MAHLRDRRAFGNIGTRKFRGARFGDPLSPRGPQYTKEGLILDYSTDVGPFTIIDQSGQDNTATLYSGRGLTMDAVNDTVTYATGYSSASRTATLWGKFNTTSPVALLGSVSGSFIFTPTATGVWEELTSTATVEGDLAWDLGLDFDIGDLRVGTEHWTHNDWSNPAGNTSNGKTIVDSGPNGYHGVCTGCSGFTGEGIDPEVAGIVGYDDAQWFNGVDTFIQTSDETDASDQSNVTFAGWILPSDVTSNQALLVQWDGANLSSFMSIRSSGLIFYTNTFPTTFALTDTNNLKKNEWQHVAGTLDSGVLKIYINGIEQATTQSGGAASMAQPNQFTIGSRKLAANPYTGVLDDFKVYYETLSESAILAMYEAGVGGSTNVTGLQHHWRENDWTDLAGDCDGTPSGTFVTVGQKRATIPQTADRNWNKYQWFNGVDTYVSHDTGSTSQTFFANKTISAKFVLRSLASTVVIHSRGSVLERLYYSSATGKLSVGGSTSTTFSPSAGVLYETELDIDATGRIVELRVNGNTEWTGSLLEVPTDSRFTVGTRLLSGTPALFFNGTIFDVSITSYLAYTGLGNDPWKDTIGSNDGTESGTFTRELVTASDANIQIDALGTAISEPRRNTQQLNLFGEGEYSSTPDSDSLDLTTEATWELWGNFYGTADANENIFSKYEGTGDDRSWAILKPLAGSSAGVDKVALSLGTATGNFSGQQYWAGLPDSVGQLLITFNGGTLEAFWNGVSLGAGALVTGTIPPIIYTGTAAATIGALSGGSSPYDRKIGSAKIYNRVLTADEVLTNYNTQKSLYNL
jgi:hypothetical protein